MEALTPDLTIMYNGRNVTADLRPYLASFEYLDNATGKSDEVTIQLADPERLFINEWFPEKGDTLEVYFGFVGNMVPAGLFEIDQIENSGPPNVVSIMGVAAPTSTSLRTKRSFAHEDSALHKIAEKVAERNGLSISGYISDNIKVRRSTQNRETDLAYLYRISKAHGFGFNVRGTSLIFYAIDALEGEGAKKTIALGDTVSYSFRAKTAETYKEATLSYHNPDTQEVVSFTTKREEVAENVSFENSIFREGESTLEWVLRSHDTLRVYEKAKDTATAEVKTRAALSYKNNQAVTGSLVVVGDVTLLAGNNIQLTGAGKFSGKYHIVSSRHGITPDGGYGTSIEIKKVG